MNRLIFILLTIPLLNVNGCKSTNDAVSHEKSAIANPIHEITIINEFSYPEALPSVTIKNALLTDSILTLTITFEGCENETIDLVWNGLYLKSMPMKATLFLVRESNKNDCGKAIERELKYNVSKLKTPGSNPLIIKLFNYEEGLTYNY